MPVEVDGMLGVEGVVLDGLDDPEGPAGTRDVSYEFFAVSLIQDVCSPFIGTVNFIQIQLFGESGVAI